MDSSGDRMPLPDANKRSPRVYTNLQNIDLDTVTFANVQATGNPIAVEEMNEDELRRLVLVNLARLVVAGEWTGLLESGGGGTGSPKFPAADMLAYYDTWDITNMPPYNRADTVAEASLNAVYQLWFPFYAPRTGSIDALSIRQGTSVPGSTEYMYVSIYDSDDDNMPQTMLGYATFDLSVGGTQQDTSLSADPSITQGELYYVAWNRSATTSASFYTWSGVGPMWGPQTVPTGDKNTMTNLATIQDAPTDAPAASTMRTYGLGSCLGIMARIPDA